MPERFIVNGTMVEDTLKRDDFSTIYFFNCGSEELAKYVCDAFNDIANYGRMITEYGKKKVEKQRGGS